jgi:hypothetical protein
VAIFPTTPQNIGGILDSGIKLCMKSAKQALPVALVGGLVANLPAIIVGRSMNTVAENGMPQMPDFGLLLIISIIAAMVLSFVFYNAIIIIVAATADEEAITIGQALGQGLRRMPAAIAAGICYMLAITVGFVLLVIPGIILSVYLYSAFYLVVLDNEGPIKALKHSYAITKGSWWRVATAMTIAIIIALILTMLFSLVVGALAFSSATAILATGIAATPLWIDLLVVPLSNAVSFIIMSSMLYAIVRDLKLRYEGQDLIARAKSLEDA